MVRRGYPESVGDLSAEPTYGTDHAVCRKSGRRDGMGITRDRNKTIFPATDNSDMADSLRLGILSGEA
jgi:hypothetical protein